MSSFRSTAEINQRFWAIVFGIFDKEDREYASYLLGEND